jgi:hypothetical protein
LPRCRRVVEILLLTYTIGKVSSVSTPENSQPVLADP